MTVNDKSEGLYRHYYDDKYDHRHLDHTKDEKED